MNINIIIQLFIPVLSLLLVNVRANQLNHYTASVSTPIKTCCDLRVYPPGRVQNGVYKMSTNMGTFTDMSTNIYCDMTTDDGGWIVTQRNRKNSELSFKKNWREYEDGFGDLNNDFWVGLKMMHTLTQTGQWEMRVDYQKNDRTWSYLHYNQFSVGSANKEYPLNIGGFTGEGVDEFGLTIPPLNGTKFSTLDNDNDQWDNNCASVYGGGWWYSKCFRINLNRQPPDAGPYVLFVEMKIRPKDCIVY